MANATLLTKLRPVARFTRICCPSCECVQGAVEEYGEPRDGFPSKHGYGVYLQHECLYCGYWIDEDDWDEVHDDLV